MADALNDIISRAPAGGTLTLPAGEFEGPVYITKPLHIIGNNTTIWAKRGNVLVVSSQGVTLEGLRLEHTGGRMNDYALLASYPAEIINVEVFGAVRGFGAEDIRFEIPRTLDLGSFAADKHSTYTIRMTVPVAAEICCSTAGLSFSPSQLQPGDNEVTVTVNGFGSVYHLFSEVFVRSQFTRRIYVTGRPVTDAAPVNGWRLTAGDFIAQSESTALSVTENNRIDIEPQELPLLEIRKLQRISLLPYIGSRCDISFSCADNGGAEIDPYVFLLDDTGKAYDIKCLVFFGNGSSPDGSVTHDAADNHISIDLNKTDDRISRIVMVYSIYGGNAQMNFSRVKAPVMKISSHGRERISYSMYNIGNAPTVIAAEFYRYEGEWKISATGWGYQPGLATLCGSYGIEVMN